MTRRDIDWRQWRDLPWWVRLLVVLGIAVLGAAVPEAMILIGFGGFELMWMVTFATLAPMGLEWLRRWRRLLALRDPVGRALRNSGLARPRVFSLALAGAGTQCLLAAPMLGLVCAMIPLLWRATT